VVEWEKAAQYLEKGKQEGFVRKSESRSLRKWPYQGRSSPTGETEGHPTGSARDPVVQGSSSGSSRMRLSHCWKEGSRLVRS